MKEKKTDTKNFWVQQLHIIKKLHGKYNNNNDNNDNIDGKQNKIKGNG